MTQPKIPTLELNDELPADPAAAAASRARAAGLVEDFVQGEALATLDTVLEAAERNERTEPELANDVSATCALVDSEVMRFRSLTRRR